MNLPELTFRERPIGSENNKELLDFLSREMGNLYYEVTSLPLKCKIWKKDYSSLERARVSFDIFPGPFSPGFEGIVSQIVYLSTLDELRSEDLNGKVVLFYGDIAREPLMPKDFPFYFPEKHKIILEILEEKQPAAVIAATGQHPMSGQNPFPLFEDGNFSIPNAYMNAESVKELFHLKGPVNLLLNSWVEDSHSKQIIARKKGLGKKKVIVSAHMDTKYGTPGSLDNGAGVMALFETMRLLNDYQGKYELEFLPFNGEEYYGVSGQLAYLEKEEVSYESIALMINLDALGHINGKIAVSFYNIQDESSFEQILERFPRVTKGPAWYAGDHSMFAFQGIPCLALTSSNLFEEVVRLTHTPDDTPENVDLGLIKEAADFVAKIIRNLA